MSLAINAAPFLADEPSVPLKGGNALRRKNANNRTVKNRSDAGQGTAKISADNINSVLMNIHESSPSNDEDLGEFLPLAPPNSVGVEQTRMRDGTVGNDGSGTGDSNPLNNAYPMDNGDSHSSQPYSVNTADMDKYRQFMPNYQQMYGNGVDIDQLVAPTLNYGNGNNNNGQGRMYGQNMGSGGGGARDPLLEKLNHVIHLLEEQQDDKTSHVTEEIILYFLLGVFVIFIVDSFTRLGKYTR
jgi:hypothetical protein